MDDLYILDGHEPVPAYDVLTWGKWFETADRRVAETYLWDGAVWVSTVFLGMDHNFYGAGLPLLFETMAFNGDEELLCERWSTWDEAEAGHRRVIEALRERAWRQ